MQERTPISARKRGRTERSTLVHRRPRPAEKQRRHEPRHRARAYQPHAEFSPHKARVKARSRARNKVARRSRRVNRLRAR